MQVRTGDQNEAGKKMYAKRGYSVRPHLLLEKVLKEKDN